MGKEKEMGCAMIGDRDCNIKESGRGIDLIRIVVCNSRLSKSCKCKIQTVCSEKKISHLGDDFDTAI